jgi:hypothetical protein
MKWIFIELINCKYNLFQRLFIDFNIIYLNLYYIIINLIKYFLIIINLHKNVNVFKKIKISFENSIWIRIYFCLNMQHSSNIYFEN